MAKAFGEIEASGEATARPRVGQRIVPQATRIVLTKLHHFDDVDLLAPHEMVRAS
jgi:hypothetical protein